MAHAMDCARGMRSGFLQKVAAPREATAGAQGNCAMRSSFLSTLTLRSSSSAISGPALPHSSHLETRRLGSFRVQAATAEAEAEAAPTTRLKKLYTEKVLQRLHNPEGFSNLNRVPRLEKIVINCGLGEASDDAKSLASTLQDLSTIAGQKAVVTRSKKAIAGFQIRKDVPVGVCVTLRGEAMFAFLDRLINLALPRIRDFQGLKTSSFDGKGNFHLGLQEQLMFPEIDYDQVQKVRGMDVSFVTSARDNDEGLQLLTALGMPFQGTKGMKPT
eukprot:TRINITY_DN17267_c0_g1_i1.p1 TRINITY_DN17267_c0_g1~~TRINITY_DN17267_c0_g1_i1.p1  ORF type:complete len:273 (+),score=91.84 TRINITY_DN17267_c0_g1_i1:138-956(+)